MALKLKEHILFWAIAASIFLADRIAKFIVLKALAPGESSPVLPFFQFTRVHNTGTFFGLFPQAKWFFLAISIIVILFILARYSTFSKNTRIALALVLGGAAGNLFDRVFYGFVIDFLDFKLWPAFNIADASITVAVLLLLFFEFKKKIQE